MMLESNGHAAKEQSRDWEGEGEVRRRTQREGDEAQREEDGGSEKEGTETQR